MKGSNLFTSLDACLREDLSWCIAACKTYGRIPFPRCFRASSLDIFIAPYTPNPGIFIIGYSHIPYGPAHFETQQSHLSARKGHPSF